MADHPLRALLGWPAANLPLQEHIDLIVGLNPPAHLDASQANVPWILEQMREAEPGVRSCAVRIVEDYPMMGFDGVSRTVGHAVLLNVQYAHALMPGEIQRRGLRLCHQLVRAVMQ